MYFTFTLWRRKLQHLARLQTFYPLLPTPLYLRCLHKVIPTCVANRVKQMRWFWLEGRATVTRGPVPRWGSRLVEVGWERLWGVGSNEERRFCFGLFPPSTPSTPPPPPSHISKDCETRWIHTLPFFLLLLCALQLFTLCWRKTPCRFGGGGPGGGGHTFSIRFLPLQSVRCTESWLQVRNTWLWGFMSQLWLIGRHSWLPWQQQGWFNTTANMMWPVILQFFRTNLLSNDEEFSFVSLEAALTANLANRMHICLNAKSYAWAQRILCCIQQFIPTKQSESALKQRWYKV